MHGYEQDIFLCLSRGFYKILSANKGQPPTSYSWDHEFQIPVPETGHGVRGLCFSFSSHIMGYSGPSSKSHSWFLLPDILVDICTNPFPCCPAVFDVCTEERGHFYKQINKNVQTHTWGCMQKVKLVSLKKCFFLLLFGKNIDRNMSHKQT